MQILNAAPRDAFTPAQITALLVAPDLQVDFGVELLDSSVNLYSSENSSFEGGTIGTWNNALIGGVNSTIANNSAEAAIGSKSLQVTWPTTTAGNSAASCPVTLIPGLQYTVGIQVYVPTGSPAVYFSAMFGVSPGSVTSTVFDAWQQLQFTFVATSTNTFFGVIPAVASTAGQYVYVDDLRAARGAVLPGSGASVDISADVSGGTVHRDNYANVHGTVDLTISRALAWGKDRVRPYMLLSSASALTIPHYGDLFPATFPATFSGDGGWLEVPKVRFNLGVYLLMTPSTPLAETPITYAVTGYDQLHMLQDNIGDSYSVAAGANVLAAVRAVLTAAGVRSPVLLDSSASASVLGSPLTWPLTSSASPTWLQVVNGLLAAINYRGIWCDWDGAFRSGPYVVPSARPVEWTFKVGDLTSGIVANERVVISDVWGAPNWWRFIQNGLTAPPVEGTGQYTVNNTATGLSSQDSVGRVVHAQVVYLDAVDQTSLAAQGDVLVAAAMRVTEVITAKLSPFPAAWAWDVVTYSDAALGTDRKAQCRSWVLPLDGSDGDYILESI